MRIKSESRRFYQLQANPMNNVKTFIRPKLYHKTSRYCISFLSLLCLLVGQDLYSQLNQLSITSQAERLNCFGDSNGQVAFSVSGGTPPYTYAWTQAGNTFVFASGQIHLWHFHISSTDFVCLCHSFLAWMRNIQVFLAMVLQ